MKNFLDYIITDAWKVVLPLIALGAVVAFVWAFVTGFIPGPFEIALSLGVTLAIVWAASSAWNFIPEKTDE